MKQIKVILDGISYRAMPMPDRSFQIFEGVNSLGNIKLGVNNSLYVQWVTADMFSIKLAQKIAEAVKRQIALAHRSNDR